MLLTTWPMKYLDLELSVLLDLLIEQTAKYTRVLSTGIKTEDEFMQCHEQIDQIQEAIHLKITNIPCKSDISSIA